MKLVKILIALLFLGLTPVLSRAQEDKKEEPWFFFQITDPQFGMFEKNNGFDKETVLYEKAVAEINRLKPDFVVITGDFVNDRNDTAQLAEFKRITAKISSEIPVYYTPGNHDVGNEPDEQSIKTYIKNYGYDKFSFTHKGALFIGINSSVIKNNLHKTERNQFKWLKETLAGNDNAQHIIVFCHYPFFIHSADEPESYSNIKPGKRKKYLSLFRRNNVDAVFSGHLHKNAAAEFKGIRLITTSAAGKPLGDAPSGFRIVKVLNSQIKHEYFGLDEIPEKVTLD